MYVLALKYTRGTQITPLLLKNIAIWPLNGQKLSKIEQNCAQLQFEQGFLNFCPKLQRAKD